MIGHRPTSYAAALLVLWADTAMAADARPLPPVLHSTGAGPVTAHFGGIAEEGLTANYSASQLWFTFPGDDRAYGFRTEKHGEAGDFRNWNLDIFAPDGDRVVLLVDDYGPYHVVSTATLKDYLAGAAPPDFAIDGRDLARSDDGIHSGATWLSGNRFEFSFSCCAHEQVMQFDLTTGRLSCIRMREATDTEKGPWRACEP